MWQFSLFTNRSSIVRLYSLSSSNCDDDLSLSNAKPSSNDLVIIAAPCSCTTINSARSPFKLSSSSITLFNNVSFSLSPSANPPFNPNSLAPLNNNSNGWLLNRFSGGFGLTAGDITEPGDSGWGDCSWGGTAGFFFFEVFPIVVRVSVNDMPGADIVDQWKK